jgi:hypothetical protein
VLLSGGSLVWHWYTHCSDPGRLAARRLLMARMLFTVELRL